jgi:beta-glucosidase/6-phospho-beta-glucosidase/beta-galactosidase
LIRVVALRKAALAGAAGALAWEVVNRSLILAGVPLFDIVRELGTLAFPEDQPLGWWPVGMAAHALVGIAWALFYGYFFWARLRLAPALQGLVFAALPAVPAALLVTPQLQLMHADADAVSISLPIFLDVLTWPAIAGLLLGHAIYGLVAGALYTHPVGYPAGAEHRPRYATSRPRRAPPRRERPHPASFIFATGIECSYPTIEQGRWRRDELASASHYERWQQDFALAREIGVTHIRYGPPLHLVFTGPGRYDWALIDEVMAELRDRGPEPIVDLCHFGLPDWLGTFQNPEMAQALAEYAGAFAERYPWVRFYTPVNEMYVCARSSTLDGMWNGERKDEGAFVTAVLNLANANIAMTDAILEARPDALLVNSESSEFCQACCPDPEVQRIADFENDRRFLPLDLIYAHEVSDAIRGYLRNHGVTDGQYREFQQRKVPSRSIVGLDYYEWNEKLITQDGEPRALGELFGWYVIASQYWRRYRRPMMYTETNRMDAAEASRWLWRQWHNVQLLRGSGAPIVGFTWYSLTDQIDWSIGMTRALGIVYPVGLFDLNRDPRPVGLSYNYLIRMYRDQPEYREAPALKALVG